MKRTFVLLLFLVCQIACQMTSKSNQRTPALINGENSQYAIQSAAIIQSRPHSSDCTAIIVPSQSHRVFLTAAHCLKNFDKSKNWNLHRGNTQLNQSEPPQTLGRIIDIKVESSGADLALGIIDKNLPAEMVPMPLPASDWIFDNSTSEKLLIGGGLEDPQISELPRIRASLKIGKFKGSIDLVGGTQFKKIKNIFSKRSPEKGDFIEASAQSPEDPHMCLGDSGGALVEKTIGGHQLIGILTTVRKIPFRGWKCDVGPMRFIPVSAYLDWISASIAELEHLER